MQARESRLRIATSKPGLLLTYVRRRAKVAYRMMAVSQLLPAVYYLFDELNGGDRLRTHVESNGARFVECPVLDFEMVVDLADAGISRDLLADGVREPLATARYRKELERLEADRGGLTVLDVGANIGYFVLVHLMSAGPDSRAIAIEPNPKSVRLLRENLRRNGVERVVDCHQCAAGAESGHLTLTRSTHSNLATVGTQPTGAHYVDEIDVQVRTIDELLDATDVPIDVVRMDLQGYEYEVFRGMSTQLDRGNVGLAFLEIHPWYLQDRDEYDPFLTLLQDEGFELTFAADGRTAVLRADKPTYAEREFDIDSIDDLRDVDVTTEVILRRQ